MVAQRIKLVSEGYRSGNRDQVLAKLSALKAWLNQPIIRQVQVQVQVSAPPCELTWLAKDFTFTWCLHLEAKRSTLVITRYGAHQSRTEPQ